MHLELIASGLNTPYSIILPPYDEQPELPDLDLSPLGPGLCHQASQRRRRRGGDL